MFTTDTVVEFVLIFYNLASLTEAGKVFVEKSFFVLFCFLGNQKSVGPLSV